MARNRDLSKLLSTANGKIVGSNLDVSFENISDTGTEGTKVASGTTGQRGSTTGQIRFNTSTNLAEYYDGTSFKAIDSPPTVSSVNTSNFESSALPTNVVISGSGFASAVTVKFIGNDGTEYAAGTTTRDSATQVTAQIPNTVTSANEPFDVKVTNSSSNLANTLADAFNIDAAPVFGVASGSLGTMLSGSSGSNLTTVTATDDEGDSISFSVTSGSIPSGLTFNSNGTFSGTASNVGSNTTSTFTVTATDGTNTSTRQYTATITAPTFVQLSGSGTWSVPSGVTSAEILIVGGGGSGGRSPNVASGGGGAGGIVHRSSYTFTSTDISNGIAYVVGDGGNGVGTGQTDDEHGAQEGIGQYGHDTTFAISGGTITAKGGGYSGGYDASSYRPARQGGSGGGGAWNALTGASSNQPTFSGWTSYGNSGGTFVHSGGNLNGAGGGGAGGVGGGATNSSGGTGGAGQLFSSFTSYGASGYFGGGGAGAHDNTSSRPTATHGGGDGGNDSNNNGGNATDTTGGGGGGASGDGYNNLTYKSGDGGNGTILIKY